ncbi:MAG: hypothetical protein O7F12_17645 [Nitrospirae bacterium]|nr:hypothetical protein [Nitrospirota bacterium]
MKFDSAKAVFCGVALLRTALPADGSETYHITMEQPAPYYSPMRATIRLDTVFSGIIQPPPFIPLHTMNV